MRHITKEQQALNAIKWIDELAKTGRKQGRGSLGSSQQGFCCLGVGCSVLDIDFHSNDADSFKLHKATGLDSNIGGLSNEGVFPYIGLDNVECNSLIQLNDSARISFRRISTQIKINARYLFVDGVHQIVDNHYSK